MNLSTQKVCNPLFSILILSLCFFGNSNYAFAETCEEDVAVTQLIKICHFEVAQAGPCDDPGGIGIPGGGVQFEIRNDDGCNGYINGKIYVANLTGPNEIPNPFSVYSLPTGVQNIYMYHSDGAGGHTSAGPYTDFKYSGVQINGSYLFEADMMMTVDVSYHCSEIGDVFHLPIDMEMRTQNNTPYPIGLYGSENGVFACNVFMENCCDYPGCQLLDPIYSGEGCGVSVSCPVPLIAPIDSSTDEALISNEEKEIVSFNLNPISKTNEKEILFTPNPFSNEFVINYQLAASSEVEVSVFDLNGNVVYSSDIFGYEGSNSTLISLEHLPSANYIVAIATDTFREIKRMVKM